MSDDLVEKIVEYIECLSVVDSMDEDEWKETRERIYNIIHNNLEKLRNDLIKGIRQWVSPNDFTENIFNEVKIQIDKYLKVKE